MEDSHERVYSKGSGVETVPLGLYIIRGENVSVVGEVDEDMDKKIDFSAIKAEPPNCVTHG
jgi:U6 snRNA-associated Sm-like protein LSm8